MNNIEQYRNRFFNLMESTIGDVKPLITEQANPDNIKEYKGKWSISNVMKNEVFKKMYKDAIDKNTKISGEEDATVVDYYNRMVNDNKLDSLVTMYDEEFPSDTQSSELDNSPITNVEDLGSIIRQSDKDKGADNFCKTESGYDICLVRKSMDKSTMDKMYNNDVRRIQGSGYSKVKESQLSQDDEGNYIKRSTWKKA